MLPGRLSEAEIRSLTKFRFIEKLPEDSEFTRYSSLLQPEGLSGSLSMISKKMEAPNDRAAASMLTKRMAFYAVIHFHAMTVLRKKLAADNGSLLLVESELTDLWLLDFHFGPTRTEEEWGVRSGWRDEIIQHVFKKILTPLIKLLLKKKVKLSERIMWENIVLYIFWLYEELIKTTEDEALLNRAQTTFII